MRELPHDFRRADGLSYGDVAADEAGEPIRPLPAESLWRSSQIEYGEWDEQRSGFADVVDAVYALAQLIAKGSTEQAQRTVRPETLRARKAAASKAGATRRRILDTKWEEV